MEDAQVAEVPNENVSRETGTTPAPEATAVSELAPVSEPKKLEVTPACEWKRRALLSYLVELSSGLVVKAKKPDWTRLIAAGVLEFSELAKSKDIGEKEATAALISLAERVLPYTLIEPALVKRGEQSTMDAFAAEGREAIWDDEMTASDKVNILLWAQGKNFAVRRQQEVE